MAGLMSTTAMTPPGGGMEKPTMGPEVAQGGMAGEQTAAPEEQKVYDEIVGRAYLLMFDEKKGAVREAVMTALTDEENPKEALAETVAMLYTRVAQEARKSGVEINPDVRMGAITEIFEKAAEIAETINGDFIKGDKEFDSAYLLAVDAVRRSEEGAGGIDREAEIARLKGMPNG